MHSATLSKELFVKIIHNIQKQEERIEKFNNALNEICDGHPIFDVDNLYLESLLELLKVIFNDKDDFIGWWLWEDVEKIVWYSKTESKDLTKPEALYDFLIDSMQK